MVFSKGDIVVDRLGRVGVILDCINSLIAFRYRVLIWKKGSKTTQGGGVASARLGWGCAGVMQGRCLVDAGLMRGRRGRKTGQMGSMQGRSGRETRKMGSMLAGSKQS